MKTKAIVWSAALTFLVLSLTGCSLAFTPGQTPAPTPSATPAPIPSTTPAPSGTPAESPTPSPSPTPTLAPCPTTPGQHPCASDVVVPINAGQTITVRIRYLLYLPGDYGKNPRQKWPLILFLHGSGEIGSDLEQVKTVPLPAWLETRSDFPFIVISPQLPGASPWASEQTVAQIQYWSPLIDPLNVLLDQLPAHYDVDTHRLYLTGLSLGGFGTWEFALRYPQRFAAIVPVAGGYIFQSDALPPGICTLKNLPVWVFYGGQDTNVQPEQSASLVKALQDCGGNVRVTYYPDATHSQTWLRAYADDSLWSWLAQQALP